MPRRPRCSISRYIPRRATRPARSTLIVVCPPALTLVFQIKNPHGWFVDADTSGYLGVTPVTIDGTVVCKPLDPAHLLAVKAISVVVRCKETRTFGTKAERTVWEKIKVVYRPPAAAAAAAAGEKSGAADGAVSAAVVYEDMGFFSKPFSLTIPPDVINHLSRAGSMSTQKTKEWKLIWKVDLVVEHRPIQFVGHSISKSYGLNLYNHASPSIPPPSPPQAVSIGENGYATLVHLNAPHGAPGPGDSCTLSFHAKPDDPAAVIKKASVVLERRIEAKTARSPSPTPTPPPYLEKPPSSSSSSTSIFRRNVSPHGSSSRTSTDSAPEVQAKAIVNKIADLTTDDITPGSGGAYWCTMNLDLLKRGAHWDIGETCLTDLVSVTFELKVKIWIKVGRTTRDFSCPPIPLTIAGVSLGERVAAQNAAMDLEAAAAAASAAAQHVTPSKRKHRSSRRGLYMHEGTLDISQDLLGTSTSVLPTAAVHARRKSKSKPATAPAPPTPILPITGVVTNIRPILRQTDSAASASASGRSTSPPDGQPTQSISFMFPSVLGGHGGQVETPVLPPIQSMLDPHTATGAAAADRAGRPPPSYEESYSILKQFQQTGRRISTTTSEEDDQPSRSRLKLDPASEAAASSAAGAAASGSSAGAGAGETRRGLPSLDALGLGLPFVPEDERPRSRPRTAPMVSTFARNIPPPLSGQLSEEVVTNNQARPMSMATSHPHPHRPGQGPGPHPTLGRTASGGTFAFGLPTVPGPPLPPQQR